MSSHREFCNDCNILVFVRSTNTIISPFINTILVLTKYLKNGLTKQISPDAARYQEEFSTVIMGLFGYVAWQFIEPGYSALRRQAKLVYVIIFLHIAFLDQDEQLNT